MASVRTYILAPNFTFQPDGPLHLGSIIADPFRPKKPLLAAKPTIETVTHTEFERTISRGDNQSLRSSVWVQFLQTASAYFGFGASSDMLTQYTMESLETVYYKSDPTDEEATGYAKDEKVQAAMKAGTFGAQPVYMITGLKIAKGFRLTSEIAWTKKGNIGARGLVTGEVSVGTEMEASNQKMVQESLRAGSDIIFAYQLHVIAEKGWWNRRIGVDLFEPKSAFLSKDKDEVRDKSFKATVASASDLLEFAEENGDDTVRTVQAQDGGNTCVCISFQEN